MPNSSRNVHDTVNSLYVNNQGWLLRWLQQKTRCCEQASDLLHDTFVRILRRNEQVRADNPEAFLMTIAKRVLIDHWRRQSIEQAYYETLASLPELEAPDPAEQHLLLETLTEVNQLLSGLPVLVRRTFLLSQLDGLKQAEIAEELQISVSTVKRYLAQAMTQCYFAYGTQDDTRV